MTNRCDHGDVDLGGRDEQQDEQDETDETDETENLDKVEEHGHIVRLLFITS